jgi:hypothetical protein
VEREESVSFIVIGHFCPTDASPEDYPDMGTLGGDLIAFGPFETKKEAEDFAREDFWLPDATVVEPVA